MSRKRRSHFSKSRSTTIQDAEFEPVPPHRDEFGKDYEILGAAISGEWNKIERRTQTFLEEMHLPASSLHVRALWLLAALVVVVVLYLIF
jgi:hypothetical protein